MKLHLPTSLRCSLLACFPTVQALFPTLAAGHVGGGLLAFAVSLAVVSSVQAAETKNYTNASLESLALSAGDIVNFSGTNTITGTLKFANNTTLTGGGLVQVSAADITDDVHTTVTGGTRLEITEGLSEGDLRNFGLGTGSVLTLSQGSTLLFGSRETVDANKNLILWNWDKRTGATLNVTGGSELYVGGVLDMKQGTTLNVTDANSTATIAGDLIISKGGSNAPNPVATVTGGNTVSVGGKISMAKGGTLAVTGKGTVLNVSGAYNSGEASNTTLDVASGATAQFGSLDLKFGATLTGGGLVRAEGAIGPESAIVNVTEGTQLEITLGVDDVDGHYQGKVFNIGTGSTLNLSDGSSLLFGSRETVDANKHLVLWNWSSGTGATLNVSGGSKLYVGGNVDMKQGTTLNVTGANSSATIAGDLKISVGGASNPVATVTGGNTVSVGGNIAMVEGSTLSVTGAGTTLTVDGIYNSTNVNNTVLDIASGSTATFADLNIGTAATIQGGGHVTVNGDANSLAGHTLTVKGQGTLVKIEGGDDQLRSEREKQSVLNIGEGATLEANKVRATGWYLKVNGIDGKGGLYKVGSYGMSMDAASTTELYLNGGVTMHITGTDNGTAAGGDGSFVLGNNSGARHNMIVINGSTLISEAAFSNKSNHADINITNNGRLQLNGGLAYYGDNHIVTLTVDGTSTLGVVGNDKSGAEHIVLNLADGATVALGAEGASQTIFNHAINADAAAKLKLCADGDARFDAAQPLHRQTLHVLAGKGTMELHGDYILGQLDNAIVNEGTLSITEGTSFDLTQPLNALMDQVGSITGVHQFISNAAGASLSGYVEHARIAYNGYVMNDEVTLGVNESGGGTLDFGDGHVGETLYWDGYSGATASGDWQPGSTLWSETEGTRGDAATGILDSVVFGLTPSGAIKDVQVGSGATNGIRNMYVTEGGYTFNGEALKLGENLTVTATGRTTFNSAVTAAHGNVMLGNWENAMLGITTEVTFNADLAATNLYVRRSENNAATGTYTFNNINVSGDIVFNVNDQRMGGYFDSTPRVHVTGKLTAGSMKIDGNAAMQFDGQVTVTDVMTVLAGNDDHNVIQLKGGSDIGRLVMDEGAKVLLSTKQAKYYIDSIELGDATLRFDAYATEFKNGGSGFTIYSTHDNATLEAASITQNYIALLDGDKDDEGVYHSFSLYSQARTMNFGTIADLKDFTVYNGVGVINAGAGSAGAIHGELRALEAGMLEVNADNIMAAGSGKVVVDNSYLHLKGTEQKLYANAAGTGNSLDLNMAYVLGDAAGTGLHAVLAAGATEGVLKVAYKRANDVGANVKLDTGTTLNLHGAAGASLTLSGVVSGAGDVLISGAGSSVTMDGADANNRLTGHVTVENGAELTLGNQDALYGASLEMLSGSTLTFETGGNFPVQLQSLNLHSDVTINIDNIRGTNVVSADSAAIWLLDQNTLLGYEQGGALTLNFTIANGSSMDQMRAYNIFAGAFNFLDQDPEVGLSLFNASIWYYNSKGEKVQLDSNHYVRGYLKQGENYVYYIRTRSGNIWAGGADGGGVWKAEGGDALWAGMESGTKDVYHQDMGSALFVDLPGGAAEVTLEGEVAPGTVYFQAELTKFTLAGSEGDYLAGDTMIEVRGAGCVNLALAGNADMDHAIAGVNAYAGTITLSENLAISGEVMLGGTAHLNGSRTGADGANRYILAKEYMASGDFANLTLGQKTIGGTADSIGSITDADIRPNAGGAGATLEHIDLGGTGTLGGATIGEGVSLAANGHYTLSGVTYFDNTITMGAGSSIALGEGGMIDIGGLDSQKDFGTNSTAYTYRLLDGDLEKAEGHIVPNLTLGSILVNGVNLGTMVNDGVITLYNGSAEGPELQAGEFKLVVNGADIMKWDTRWNEGGGPALGKVNTTDAVLYDKNGANPDKYLYSNLVKNVEGADKIIVGSISREWVNSGGTFSGSKGGDKEIWVFNQGVGGFTQFVVGSNGGDTQEAATHLVITGGVTSDSAVTAGGSALANQTADSFITLRGTEETLKRGKVIGGSWSSDQTAASHVFMDGGEILTWLVAGSYNGWVDSSWLNMTGGKVKLAFGGSSWDKGSDRRTSGVKVGGAHTTISGGTIETLFGGSDHGVTNGGAHTTITGGTITNLYGGGRESETNGGIELTVDGAKVTNLYASNQGGTVNGDVVLSLLSGSANMLYAGQNNAKIIGNYTVRLGSDFVFSNGRESDSLAGTFIYGGLQANAGVTFDAKHSSTLELVSENATYDFAGKYQGDNADHSTKIMGFSKVLLANGVTMIVHNAAFNNDQNLVIGMLGEEEEGKSLSATVVYGNYEEVGGHSSKGTRKGSMTLQKGITLKLATSYAHDSFSNMLATPHLYVERGATFDISCFPREQANDDGGGSISFQLHLAGNGVDDKGALFKGEGFASSSPDGKAALGHVILDDNASVNADGANIIFDYADHADSYIEFDQHTLTKIGSMTLRLYHSNEGEKNRVLADGTTQAVRPGGTMYVKEGSVDYRKVNRADEVDYVLGGSGTLSVTLDDAASSLSIRSLSGAGTVKLNHNTTLSMHSDYDSHNGAFYSDWLDESEKYNTYAEGGYAYGIFSGKITSEDSSSSLIKTGKGTQALLGDQSTYSGLTVIQDGTLYLMGTSYGTLTGKGKVAPMTSGSAGVSSLVWEKASNGDPEPVLRLGHETVIYNDGYARGGADMTIEVSAAPNGVALDSFVVQRGDTEEFVTWMRGGEEYRRVDVSSLKSVNVDGVYANGEVYKAGDTIDRSRALYVSEADLKKTVSADLNTDVKKQMYGSVEGEQLDNSKLSNGMTLDCNAYYGDGSICVAGSGLDLDKAKKWGVYVPSDLSLSPKTADLLLYAQSPLVYAQTTYDPEKQVETTTYYNQYELVTPLTLDDIKTPEATPLREDSIYYVRYVEINNRKTQMFTSYLTYAELNALLEKQNIVGGRDFTKCELVTINRICVDAKNDDYNNILAENPNLNLILGETSTVVADVPLQLDGYTVKESVLNKDKPTLSCNGYYVNDRFQIVGRYLAGDKIALPEGATMLLVPEMFKDQAWAVVTGLSKTGYEEAVFSGVLTDDGKTASHLTKQGAGTLVLDQQSIYTGDTKLEGGTLRLRGWGDLQNGMDRRGSGRFIQSAGTSLMLSYANEEKYTSLGDQEVRELRKDLELVGSGDSRWRNEAETDYQTAALISDVGKDVSFTLSGVLSGDGNLLHSGKGQLHISGANTYEGGTTVTKGVVYVEDTTALGKTAQGASAKVVTYEGSTLVLTNGLGGTNAAGLVGEGYVQFHSNHNSIKGTVLIGGYDKGSDIRTDGFADPGVGQGSTLVMTGNGYWAENTIISKNSALVFNGSGSSNYTVDGTNREVRVDQSAENKAGHLGGAGKLVVSGPAGKGLAVYFDNIGESADGAGDNFTGGIRVEGNNSRLFFGRGDYTATAENGGIHVTGYFSRLNAEHSNITVADGGNVTLSSLGYYSNPNLNPSGTGTQGAAGIRAQSVTVQKGGTLAARNAPSAYMYNITDIAKDTQLSIADVLPGNRTGAAPVYSEETKGLWQNILGDQVGSLSAAEDFKAYEKAYDTNLAVNKNRAASVNAQLTFEKGSCYEAYFANTRLGQGASLTLEAGTGLTRAGGEDNRIVLDLSTNGNHLQWDKDGGGISQIVLFTDVENLVFKYGDTIIDTSAAAYDGKQIFYAAAKDFFLEKTPGLYLSDETYIVYDKEAQIVYLDATLPEPTTATLSLLALTALCARRRRK